MHRASVFGVHLSRFTTLTRSYNKLKLVNRPAIRLLTNAKQTPEEIEQDLTENMEYEVCK